MDRYGNIPNLSSNTDYDYVTEKKQKQNKLRKKTLKNKSYGKPSKAVLSANIYIYKKTLKWEKKMKN